MSPKVHPPDLFSSFTRIICSDKAVLCDDASCLVMKGFYSPAQAAHTFFTGQSHFGAIQRSWFGRVNALCNLSCKKSREVAAHFQVDF